VDAERAVEQVCEPEALGRHEARLADRLGIDEPLDRVDDHRQRGRIARLLQRAADDVEPVLVERHRQWGEVTAARAPAGIAVREPDDPPRQHAGQEGVEDVLLALVRLRAAVGDVGEALAEPGVLGALLGAHPLLELLLQAADVLPERRAAQHVEQARDREQRVAFAPRDRDVRVGLLDEAHACPALDQHRLDLEPDAAQVGEVAAHGALARVDHARQLAELAPAAEPAQLVEHAQNACDMLQITPPIHV
jgi:hypothetical protein